MSFMNFCLSACLAWIIYLFIWNIVETCYKVQVHKFVFKVFLQNTKKLRFERCEGCNKFIMIDRSGIEWENELVKEIVGYVMLNKISNELFHMYLIDKGIEYVPTFLLEKAIQEDKKIIVKKCEKLADRYESFPNFVKKHLISSVVKMIIVVRIAQKNEG